MIEGRSGGLLGRPKGTSATYRDGISGSPSRTAAGFAPATSDPLPRHLTAPERRATLHAEIVAPVPIRRG